MIPLVAFNIPRDGEELDPADWTSCLETWTMSVRSYLTVSQDEFAMELQKSDSIPRFLQSYVHEQCNLKNRETIYRPSQDLSYKCFLLFHRAWFSSTTPRGLLGPSIIRQLCILYGNLPQLPDILDQLWKEKNLSENHDFLENKTSLQRLLESKSLSDMMQLDQFLYNVRVLLKNCQEYGRFLMLGSDLLDGLIRAYQRTGQALQKKITLVTYQAVVSLAVGEEPKLSVFADHVYALRIDHEAQRSGKSLLAGMITSTPFVQICRKIAGESKTTRLASIIPFLESIGTPSHKRPSYKGKEIETGSHQYAGQEHLISHIQELFPHLELDFVKRLLNHYGNDAEKIIACLLDDSLPEELREIEPSQTSQTNRSHGTRQSTTLAALEPRRNLYDHDELDRLHVSVGKLHMGKKQYSGPSIPASKDSVLAALANLDPDDDEHDDTYDAEDVGGTVDMVKPEEDLAERTEVTPIDETLYALWTSSTAVFARDSVTRASSDRAKLRQETGLTDEAIEGWALMIEREPSRLRRLQASQSFPIVAQPELASSAWKADLDSDPDTEMPRSGIGRRGRGRGRPPRRGLEGRVGGRMQGTVAGPTDDASIQHARQKKDANKASRANHDRRRQRARKVARAGL